MDEFYTVKQAAILLKVHPLTIRRYINEGRLKAVRVGGNVRISQNDLHNFAESYSASPHSGKGAPTIPTTIAPFSPADPLFRLKGRGISLGNV